MNRIEELLEQRSVLIEMASVMYGDLYITNEHFWNSSIEKDMFEIESELIDLGHEDEEVSPEMEFAARVIFDLLKKDGTIPNEREDEEDTEDFDDFLQ
jgi:hypothetical protein